MHGAHVDMPQRDKDMWLAPHLPLVNGRPDLAPYSKWMMNQNRDVRAGVEEDTNQENDESMSESGKKKPPLFK